MPQTVYDKLSYSHECLSDSKLKYIHVLAYDKQKSLQHCCEDNKTEQQQTQL